MPDRERVLQLIQMVERGRYVEAIEQFYTDDATMQENFGVIRQGRETLVAHERKAMASVKEIRTLPGSTFTLDDDRVVVHWRFDIEGKDGGIRRLDELAHQRWVGDRIAEERFYYDPKAHTAE